MFRAKFGPNLYGLPSQYDPPCKETSISTSMACHPNTTLNEDGLCATQFPPVWQDPLGSAAGGCRKGGGGGLKLRNSQDWLFSQACPRFTGEGAFNVSCSLCLHGAAEALDSGANRIHQRVARGHRQGIGALTRHRNHLWSRVCLCMYIYIYDTCIYIYIYIYTYIYKYIYISLSHTHTHTQTGDFGNGGGT